jgi:hypothetical protein
LALWLLPRTGMTGVEIFLFPAPAHVVRKPCLIGTASGWGGGGRSAGSGGGGGGGSGRSSSTSVTSAWPAPPSASAGGPSTCSCRRIVPKKSGGKRLKIPNPQRTAVHPVETKKKQNRCWHAMITPTDHMNTPIHRLHPLLRRQQVVWQNTRFHSFGHRVNPRFWRPCRKPVHGSSPPVAVATPHVPSSKTAARPSELG